MQYPPSLLRLISLLKKLPGIGSKSAERFAFHMLQWDCSLLEEMGKSIANIKKEIHFCPQCGAMAETLPCALCDPEKRDCSRLCIVSSFKDIFLIENTGEYRGLYHVLGGIISPLHGKEIAQEKVLLLNRRIALQNVREVILALDPTLEGDATALYIKQALEENRAITLSRLALGIPMGSSLDYIDPGTLAYAFSGRSKY